MLNPVLPAAALIFVLMMAEVGASAWLRRGLYRLPDTLSSLGSSLGQLVIQAMFGFTTLAMYAFAHEHLAVLDWPTGPLGWVLAFLLMELAFYWRHRAGHELAVFWTIHEVHHQSSQYNYAVAQRVGYLQWLQTGVFVLPLAVLGVDPFVFGVLFSAIHFWQFLIHTRLVGRLGPLDAVLVTPSVHRVHHARNPRYLDKNYGFTLTVFDRVFGTWQPEVETPEFGTLAPLHSHNPVDNNVRPWLTLARRMGEAPSTGAALALPLRHPAWDPRARRRRLPSPDTVLPPRAVPAERGSTPRTVLSIGALVIATVGALALVQYTFDWSAPLRLIVGASVVALTAAATSALAAPALGREHGAH